MTDLVQLTSSIHKPDRAGAASSPKLLSSSAPLLLSSSSPALPLAHSPTLPLAPSPPSWRRLEELANSDQFQEIVHREFPQYASEWTDDTSRRTFLKLMGASLALAGVTACTRQPKEEIAPYVRQPEQIVPGKSLFFATAMTVNGV